MLVLTRRVGEEIVLDGNIRVAVVAVSGGKVRLGISAPSSVHIVRQELLASDAGGAALTVASNGPTNSVCPTSDALPSDLDLPTRHSTCRRRRCMASRRSISKAG